MGPEYRYRDVSLWFSNLPAPIKPRSPLPGDTDVDVAIVGAGFTGLWAAYYLLEADPSLRVALAEREVAGFGASGRNGGWCAALFAAPEARVRRVAGAAAATSLRHALEDTINEVGRVVVKEGIDCHFAKGGTVTVARTPIQLERAHAKVERARKLGVGEDDLVFLGQVEARKLLGAEAVLGGTYTPHCASVDPARLSRGLADVVERRGARIYEHSPVVRIESGRLQTPFGDMRAPIIIRATEAYGDELDDRSRVVVPIYSLMIATAPLPEPFWSQIGLARRETFADHRHLIIYGQRTADDRLAIGGQGAFHHLGSKIHRRFEDVPRHHEALRRTLVDMFPVLADVEITHRWGGAFGATRDWFPSVGIDRSRGLAWAGGYAGEGVAASNLAGRTLADLVVKRTTDLTKLPWVGHRSPSWPPEPLLSAGIRGGLAAIEVADRLERHWRHAPRWSVALDRLAEG